MDFDTASSSLSTWVGTLTCGHIAASGDLTFSLLSVWLPGALDLKAHSTEGTVFLLARCQTNSQHRPEAGLKQVGYSLGGSFLLTSKCHSSPGYSLQDQKRLGQGPCRGHKAGGHSDPTSAARTCEGSLSLFFLVLRKTKLQIR